MLATAGAQRKPACLLEYLPQSYVLCPQLHPHTHTTKTKSHPGCLKSMRPGASKQQEVNSANTLCLRSQQKAETSVFLGLPRLFHVDAERLRIRNRGHGKPGWQELGRFGGVWGTPTCEVIRILKIKILRPRSSMSRSPNKILNMSNNEAAPLGTPENIYQACFESSWACKRKLGFRVRGIGFRV